MDDTDTLIHVDETDIGNRPQEDVDELEEHTELVKEKTKRKAKAAKKAAAKKDKPAALDQFGFRKGTIRAQAAAVYSRPKGATLAEVREKVGSNQYNLLTALKKKGFKIKAVEETSKGNRPAARYFLTPKK